MNPRPLIVTIVILLAGTPLVAPQASATNFDANDTPTIVGAAQACRCCITQIGPLGVVHICKECHYASCQCDFDALGLPRCTGAKNN